MDRDVELLGDLGVREPHRHHLEHLELAGGEAREGLTNGVVVGKAGLGR